MSTLNPALPTLQEPAAKHGAGGPANRYPGNGGGGDHRGGGASDFGDQLRRYRLGLAVGLAAVVMLFISFTSAFIVRQGLGSWDPRTSAYVTDWQPVKLPTALLLVNTVILLASSVTIEKARRNASQRAVLAPVTAMPGISAGNEKPAPWLWITVVLGAGFLIGQLTAWRVLEQRGFFISSNPSSSFFYVLTGMHGLHLLGGLLALFYAAAISLRSQAWQRYRIVVDVTAWYWHFMALLWIYVFVLLKFAA
jgi:cytochrome c oxidase subunit 3